MAVRAPNMKNNTSSTRLTLLRILTLAVVILISVFIFSIREDAARLAIYGYPGVFLLAFLSYATVLLPAPGVAIVFTLGGVLHPAGVALTAGLGAALGEISGYLAGFSGQAVIERTPMYDRLQNWMSRNGPLTVLLLSAIPNPFFDIAGVVAGALKMPMRNFLFWAWIGETVKMSIFAYLGAQSFDWLNRLGL